MVRDHGIVIGLKKWRKYYMLNLRNSLSLEALLTMAYTLVNTKAIKIGKSELVLGNRAPEELYSTVPEARAKRRPRFHCNSPTGDSRWRREGLKYLDTLTEKFCSDHSFLVDTGNLVNYERLFYYHKTDHIPTDWHPNDGKIPDVYKYRISSQVNCVPEKNVYDLRGSPQPCMAIFERIWTDCKYFYSFLYWLLIWNTGQRYFRNFAAGGSYEPPGSCLVYEVEPWWDGRDFP